jgi:hypothetical protein
MQVLLLPLSNSEAVAKQHGQLGTKHNSPRPHVQSRISPHQQPFHQVQPSHQPPIQFSRRCGASRCVCAGCGRATHPLKPHPTHNPPAQVDGDRSMDAVFEDITKAIDKRALCASVHASSHPLVHCQDGHCPHQQGTDYRTEVCTGQRSTEAAECGSFRRLFTITGYW